MRTMASTLSLSSHYVVEEGSHYYCKGNNIFTTVSKEKSNHFVGRIDTSISEQRKNKGSRNIINNILPTLYIFKSIMSKQEIHNCTNQTFVILDFSA